MNDSLRSGQSGSQRIRKNLDTDALWSAEALVRADGASPSRRAKSVLIYFLDNGLGRLDLLFITHSFGGLVVKQMLATSEMCQGPLKAIAEATRGVVFFATSHAGSSAATIASRLLVASKVTKDLQTDDPLLRLPRDAADGGLTLVVSLRAIEGSVRRSARKS